MVCELVTVVVVAWYPARPARAPVLKRGCLHAILREANRKGNVIVDFRDLNKPRVYWPKRRPIPEIG